MPDKILDIDKPLCAERQRKFFGAIDNSLRHLVVNAVRRVYRNGVAAVNPGAFDMFHYSGNEHVFSVRDNIDFKFHTHHIFIDENRVVYLLREYSAHIKADFLFIVDYSHILPADNV